MAFPFAVLGKVWKVGPGQIPCTVPWVWKYLVQKINLSQLDFIMSFCPLLPTLILPPSWAISQNTSLGEVTLLRLVPSPRRTFPVSEAGLGWFAKVENLILLLFTMKPGYCGV